MKKEDEQAEAKRKEENHNITAYGSWEQVARYLRWRRLGPNVGTGPRVALPMPAEHVCRGNRETGQLPRATRPPEEPRNGRGPGPS